MQRQLLQLLLLLLRAVWCLCSAGPECLSDNNFALAAADTTVCSITVEILGPALNFSHCGLFVELRYAIHFRNVQGLHLNPPLSFADTESACDSLPANSVQVSLCVFYDGVLQSCLPHGVNPTFPIAYGPLPPSPQPRFLKLQARVRSAGTATDDDDDATDVCNSSKDSRSDIESSCAEVQGEAGVWLLHDSAAAAAVANEIAEDNAAAADDVVLAADEPTLVRLLMRSVAAQFAPLTAAVAVAVVPNSNCNNVNDFATAGLELSPQFYQLWDCSPSNYSSSGDISSSYPRIAAADFELLQLRAATAAVQVSLAVRAYYDVVIVMISSPTTTADAATASGERQRQMLLLLVQQLFQRTNGHFVLLCAADALCDFSDAAAANPQQLQSQERVLAALKLPDRVIDCVLSTAAADDSSSSSDSSTHQRKFKARIYRQPIRSLLLSDLRSFSTAAATSTTAAVDGGDVGSNATDSTTSTDDSFSIEASEDITDTTVATGDVKDIISGFTSDHATATATAQSAIRFLESLNGGGMQFAALANGCVDVNSGAIYTQRAPQQQQQQRELMRERLQRGGFRPFLPLLPVQQQQQQLLYLNSTAAVIKPYYERNIYHHFQSISGMLAAAFALQFSTASTAAAAAAEEVEEEEEEEESGFLWVERLRYLLLPRYNSRSSSQPEWNNAALDLAVKYICAMRQFVTGNRSSGCSSGSGSCDLLLLMHEQLRSFATTAATAAAAVNATVASSTPQLICFRELILVGQAETRSGFFASSAAAAHFRNFAATALNSPLAAAHFDAFHNNNNSRSRGNESSDKNNSSSRGNTSASANTATSKDFESGAERQQQSVQQLQQHQQQCHQQQYQQQQQQSVQHQQRQLRVTVVLRSANRRVLNLPRLHRTLLQQLTAPSHTSSSCCCSSGSSSNCCCGDGSSNCCCGSGSSSNCCCSSGSSSNCCCGSGSSSNCCCGSGSSCNCCCCSGSNDCCSSSGGGKIRWVYLEMLTLREQLRLMQQTDILIAVHGSAFINAALFMGAPAVAVAAAVDTASAVAVKEGVTTVSTATATATDKWAYTNGGSPPLATCIALMQSRHIEFALPQVVQQSGSVRLHILPVLHQQQSSNCEPFDEAACLHGNSSHHRNDNSNSSDIYSTSHSSSGSSSDNINSGVSLLVAGGYACLGIRNCDVRVDALWFEALFALAAAEVAANIADLRRATLTHRHRHR